MELLVSLEKYAGAKLELSNKVNGEFSAGTAGLADGKFLGPGRSFHLLLMLKNKKIRELESDPGKRWRDYCRNE